MNNKDAQHDKLVITKNSLKKDDGKKMGELNETKKIEKKQIKEIQLNMQKTDCNEQILRKKLHICFWTRFN